MCNTNIINKRINIYPGDLGYKHQIIATVGSDRLGVLYKHEEITYVSRDSEDKKIIVSNQLNFPEMLLISRALGELGSNIVKIRGTDGGEEFVECDIQLDDKSSILLSSNTSYMEHLKPVIGFNNYFFRTEYNIASLEYTLRKGNGLKDIISVIYETIEENEDIVTLKEIKYNSIDGELAGAIISSLDIQIFVIDNNMYIMSKKWDRYYFTTSVEERVIKRVRASISRICDIMYNNIQN